MRQSRLTWKFHGPYCYLFFRPHVNKKKRKRKKRKIQKIEKMLEENKNIYISEKSISEHPANCQRQVEEDQNIQN